MLTRLYATNYRCLVNFEFKPSAKQLIIGRNGAGKTTVFDVLAMLRDLVVSGEACEKHLGGATRTRWQDIAEQRFELDVKGNGGEYRYVLVEESHEETHQPSVSGLRPGGKRGWLETAALGRIPNPFGPRLKEELLEFNGSPLFFFKHGVLGLFNDQQKPKPTVTLPFDGFASGLATVQAGRRDNKKLSWFKRWLDGLLEVQINPWVMSARSERESAYPAENQGNFADWYRHLLLESSEGVFAAIRDLREAIPGFETLDLKEAGLEVRVLQASFSVPRRQRLDVPFHELSEGQRALIALYVLLNCAVGEDRLLLIDEPDNFIALAEIQPWLLKLLDRVDETRGQVMLVSHHPELLNQMADQGGVVLERPSGSETRIVPFQPPEDSGLTASEIVARGWELGTTDSK